MTSSMRHTLPLMPRLPRADLAVLGAVVLGLATRASLEHRAGRLTGTAPSADAALRRLLHSGGLSYLQLDARQLQLPSLEPGGAVGHRELCDEEHVARRKLQARLQLRAIGVALRVAGRLEQRLAREHTELDLLHHLDDAGPRAHLANEAQLLASPPPPATASGLNQLATRTLNGGVWLGDARWQARWEEEVAREDMLIELLVEGGGTRKRASKSCGADFSTVLRGERGEHRSAERIQEGLCRAVWKLRGAGWDHV